MEPNFGQCFIPNSTTIVTAAALVMMKPYTEFCAINNILPPKVVDTDVVTVRTEDSVRGMIKTRTTAGLIPVSDSVFNIYGTECSFHSGAFGESKQFHSSNFRRLADPDSACRQGVFDSTKYMAGEAARMFYRTLVRMEYTIWAVLLTGIYNTYDSFNNLVRRQYYPIRRVIANPFITDVKNSRPLNLFNYIAAYFTETDVSFWGSKVEYWVNSVTLLKIMENQNPADLGKFTLSAACCDVLGMKQINSAFASRNLGTFHVCDSKYLNNAGVSTKFLKDGYVLVKGVLPGYEKGGYFALVNPSTTTFGCFQKSNSNILGGQRGLGGGVWFKKIDTCAISLNPHMEMGIGFDGMPVIPRPDIFISVRLF